jgi:hypothetical protein
MDLYSVISDSVRGPAIQVRSFWKGNEEYMQTKSGTKQKHYAADNGERLVKTKELTTKLNHPKCILRKF